MAPRGVRMVKAAIEQAGPCHAPDRIPNADRCACARAPAGSGVRAGRPEMDHQLGRVGAGPLPGRQSVGAAGQSVWSDAVTLPFVKNDGRDLSGRRLAVSFHIVGDSGPMTWHAKALTTSYVTPSGAGAKGQTEDESAFPFATASWFFLDA